MTTIADIAVESKPKPDYYLRSLKLRLKQLERKKGEIQTQIDATKASIARREQKSAEFGVRNA